MIKRAIFTNSTGTFASRILGFIRDLMMASILGANIYSDIFFVAFKLPNLFRRVFAEGAFTQAFLPSFVGASQKGAFTMNIFFRFLAAIILFSVVVVIFDSFFTKLIAFGFDRETIELAAPLVAINFWYLDFVFIVTFFGALLQYRSIFWVSAYSSALLNIALIGALIIAREKEQNEIVYILSYGVLVGGLLQVLLHIIPLKNAGLFKLFDVGIKEISRKKDRSQDSIRRFYKQFFPAVLGSSTAHISAFIDTFLASFLMAGSISYLYYANRIFQLPMALFAIATAVALFPTIAKAIKNSDEEKALNFLKNSFWFLAFVLTLSTIGGIILSKEIVWLLFERGEFSREDTEISALVLSMYMIGLLPFGLAKIFSLWLYSKQKQVVAAKISAKALGVNIIFSLALIYPFGVFGLSLASSFGGFVLFVLTIKEFGYDKFITIIKDIKLFYLIFVLIVEIVLLLTLKNMVEIF